MANYGIKVSQPNKDVKTCDDKDLTFSSQWNTFKIAQQGYTSLEVNPGQNGTLEIAHNLGYSPCFLVYIDSEEGHYYCAMDDCKWQSNVATIYAWSNTSKLRIQIYNPSGSNKSLFNISYFLLVENNA